MAESLPVSARMATNMMFVGTEASRAIANYTKQNAREAAARTTSNTARRFAQTVKERVQVLSTQYINYLAKSSKQTSPL